ncbi:MAG: glycyl-radical enzyme activating protein [Clostridia bacterium]|nr:glycyl-radical enzyme activating protein [Clostridia bacterium]
MTRLNVSNIQHFSVGDGPGIRTTVFLKGCNLRCPWCHNPETVSPATQELYFEKANKTVVYGKLMTIDELLTEIMEDEAFYRESGGGITVSGGEPLLQSEGVADLLEAARKEKISTLVDTAGDVPWESLAQVIPFTDVFYFDIKSGSAEDYATVIKGNAERILNNLSRLIAERQAVHVRIPLIPNFNTSVNSCEEICQRLIAAGVRQVDLLPFHRMGSAKYEALGREYAYRSISPQSPQEIEQIAEIYRKHFHTTIEK